MALVLVAAPAGAKVKPDPNVGSDIVFACIATHLLDEGLGLGLPLDPVSYSNVTDGLGRAVRVNGVRRETIRAAHKVGKMMARAGTAAQEITALRAAVRYCYAIGQKPVG